MNSEGIVESLLESGPALRTFRKIAKRLKSSLGIGITDSSIKISEITSGGIEISLRVSRRDSLSPPGVIRVTGNPYKRSEDPNAPIPETVPTEFIVRGTWSPGVTNMRNSPKYVKSGLTASQISRAIQKIKFLMFMDWSERSAHNKRHAERMKQHKADRATR